MLTGFGFFFDAQPNMKENILKIVKRNFAAHQRVWRFRQPTYSRIKQSDAMRAKIAVAKGRRKKESRRNRQSLARNAGSAKMENITVMCHRYEILASLHKFERTDGLWRVGQNMTLYQVLFCCVFFAFQWR